MESNSREEHCLTGYNYSAFAVPPEKKKKIVVSMYQGRFESLFFN